MAIPNGYRLLTAEDIGKTFGVELEPIIYFDTKVPLTGNESYFAPDVETPISGGLLYTFGGSNAVITLNNYGMTELVWEASSGWRVSNIDMGSGVNSVGDFNEYIPEDWNTWLYVRDIGWTDPYDIKIKNKEGIKLLTKDKDIHFSDDVKITIDEGLLGGGEAKKYNFTLTYRSMNGVPADLSIDGGDFTEIDYDTNLGKQGATGQANFLVLWSDGEIIGYSADDESAKFNYIKQSGSYPASCLVITLLKDNAVIYVEGED